MNSFARLCLCFALVIVPLLHAGCVDAARPSHDADAPLGVNWGRRTTHSLPPKLVVDMLLANGITNVKIFDTEPQILNAVRGTPIELMVAVPNHLLEPLATENGAADRWLHENIIGYLPNVNIKYIAVGNEPLLLNYGGLFKDSIYLAFKNVVDAVKKAGLIDKIKVTVPLTSDMLDNGGSWRPSNAVFRYDLIRDIESIADLLSETRAPFTVNIYPFFSMIQDQSFPLDFAFCDDIGIRNAMVDGDKVYSNSLDATYDMLLAALKKIGRSDLEVVVGEIGWPTEGHPATNVSLARRFVQSLVRHLPNGSPVSRKPIKAYLFGLFDEDGKEVINANFERHWGLFAYDGKAKYPLDLSGSGTELVEAKGVTYLPQSWCVYNGRAKSARDLHELRLNVNHACDRADCTAIEDGGSCSNISDLDKASYAFNSYYQMHNQAKESCEFHGFSNITATKPSVGSCPFNVQLDNVKLGNPSSIPTSEGTQGRHSPDMKPTEHAEEPFKQARIHTPMADNPSMESFGVTSIYGYANILVMSVFLIFQLL